MLVVCLCPNCESEIQCVRRAIWDFEPALVECSRCGVKLTTHLPVIAEEFEFATEETQQNLPRPFEARGWQSLGVLGRGGMGVVYSIMHKTDRHLRAVKVLPPECSKYPELIERFHLETRSLASLNHPNIVGIQEIGLADGLCYFVMDYVSGANLKDVLYERKRLTIDEAMTIASAVAEALQCCHDQGMVHRDLKPANVMLTQAGTIKLMDFGIANFLTNLGEKTDHGVQIGTPQYISPEQVENGSKVDERADQYSLAVILYEMIVGHLPQGVFEKPSEARKDARVELDAAIYRALNFKREARFPSIRAFTRAARTGQKTNIPNHKAQLLIRDLAMSVLAGKRAPANQKTPKIRRDLSVFSLSHPARDVTSEENIEDLFDDTQAPKQSDETPKAVRLERYRSDETPMAPTWFDND